MNSEPTYHINPEGQSRSCRARKKPCPFGEWNDHYDTKEEAQKGYEEKQEMLAMTNTGKTKKHPLTKQAISSKMSYNGPTPQWLEKEQQKSAQYFDTAPEIIDTVEIEGREYAVVWSENSLDDGEYHIQKTRGFNIHAIEYVDMETGKVVAYIKSAYRDKDAEKKSYGNDEFSEFRIFDDRSGETNIIVKDYDNIVEEGDRYFVGPSPAPYDKNSSEEEILEAKKRIWLTAHKSLYIKPENASKSLYFLTEDDAPENMAELDAGIQRLKEHVAERNENYRKSHGFPIVDYSDIVQNLRGQGIGTSMYVYMARKLGEKDKMLLGSGIQTGEAQSLWKRIAGDEELNTTVVSHRYFTESNNSTVQKFALDYRKNNNVEKDLQKQVKVTLPKNKKNDSVEESASSLGTLKKKKQHA